MDVSDADYKERLKAFQTDLSRPSAEVVHKHVLTGTPAALTADEYFALRHAVAVHFKVQPVEVVLVGSCRTGFTLRDKHEKGRPRYSPVRNRSDLDLAVVSERLFNQFWDDIFEYWKQSKVFQESDAWKMFRHMLFQGWVDPRGLPPGRSYQQADDWKQFFDGLTRDRRFGNRRTTARVYRDWARLAAYQRIEVEECQLAHRKPAK